MELPDLVSELTSDVAAGTGGALIPGLGLLLLMLPLLLLLPAIPFGDVLLLFFGDDDENAAAV